MGHLLTLEEDKIGGLVVEGGGGKLPRGAAAMFFKHPENRGTTKRNSQFIIYRDIL